MKRSITRWTTTVAAAALLTIPAGALAQTPQQQQPPQQQTQPTTAQDPAQSTQQGNATEHLSKAEAALNDVSASAVPARAKTRLTALKRHINALQRASASNDNASTTGAANRNTKATKGARGNANWATELAAADKILNELLGPASANTQGTAGTSGTTGTTGTPAKSSTTLDETTRAKLMEVRTHLTAFASAMSGTSSPAATSSTPDTTASGTTGSTSATSGTAGSTTGSTTGSTAGSMTGSTSGTTGSTSATGTMAGQQTAQPQSGQAQVDPEAAKQHLTAARDSLSALTQLPAAAQLTGDARTHVTQLISNFNALITTTTDWRAAYDKVEANLTALIGPQTTTATGTQSGTPGAVGTSGTATVDPAIREKLVEMREHLNKFEKAAGGDKTPDDPAAAAAAATGTAATGTTSATGTTGTTGSTSGTTASGTSGTTGSMTGTAGSATGTTAGTAGTAGTTPAASASPMSADTRTALRQHVDAIEALLNNNPTLDAAKMQQLKAHVTELKAILASDKK